MLWRILTILCLTTLLAVATAAIAETQPDGTVTGTSQHDEFDWSDPSEDTLRTLASDEQADGITQQDSGKIPEPATALTLTIGILTLLSNAKRKRD